MSKLHRPISSGSKERCLCRVGSSADAIDKGYKAYFRSMDEILTALKLKDVAASAKRGYKNLFCAQVIVMDDLMNISVSRQEGNLLFAFIVFTPEKTDT